MKDFNKPRPAAVISQVRPPAILQDNFSLRTFFHSGYDVVLTLSSLNILLGYCTRIEGTEYHVQTVFRFVYTHTHTQTHTHTGDSKRWTQFRTVFTVQMSQFLIILYIQGVSNMTGTDCV